MLPHHDGGGAVQTGITNSRNELHEQVTRMMREPPSGQYSAARTNKELSVILNRISTAEGGPRIDEKVLSQFLRHGMRPRVVIPPLAKWLQLDVPTVESLAFEAFAPRDFLSRLLHPEPSGIRAEENTIVLPDVCTSYFGMSAAAVIRQLIRTSGRIYLLRIDPDVGNKLGISDIVQSALTSQPSSEQRRAKKRIVEFSRPSDDQHSHRTNALAVLACAHKGEGEYVLLDGSRLQTSGIVTERDGAFLFSPRMQALRGWFFPAKDRLCQDALEDVETEEGLRRPELLTWHKTEKRGHPLVADQTFEESVLEAQLQRKASSWWYLSGPSRRHQPPDVIQARMQRVLAKPGHPSHPYLRRAAATLRGRYYADAPQGAVREHLTLTGLTDFVQSRSFRSFGHDAFATAGLTEAEVKRVFERMIDLTDRPRHEFAITSEPRLVAELNHVEYMLKDNRAFFEVYGWNEKSDGKMIVDSRTNISTTYPDLYATMVWYSEQMWDRLSPQSKDAKYVKATLRRLREMTVT